MSSDKAVYNLTFRLNFLKTAPETVEMLYNI